MFLYIIFIIIVIILIYYLYKQVDTSHKLHPDGDKTVKLKTNNKPLLWVHVPDETGVINWTTFMDRNINTQYLAIYRLCLNSIMLHNSNDFHIVLLHKNNINYYLPEFNYPSNASDINLLSLKYTILNTYGGIFMPIHTLCFKSLSHVYYTKFGTIINKNPDLIVFGNMNSSIVFSYYPNKTTKQYAKYYTERKNSLGGGNKFDNIPDTLDVNNKVFILSDDHIGKTDINGDIIDISDFTSQNHIRTKYQNNQLLISIDNDIFSKELFMYKMNEKQLLTSNMWISHLLAKANMVEVPNMPNRDQSIWELPKNIIVYK